MDGLQQYLLELSDRLDDEGQTKCADAVDELIKTASLQKLAQYVGVIGYVLKQNRAMGNCIRKKRVASNASMQEVVLQCLKEYQDGQDYWDTEWTQKYAQIIKEEPKKFDAAHLAFLAAIGEASQMDEHLNIVHKTAELLQEHGIDEPVFNSVLAHLGTLGTLLDKDATSQSPFKVAAPPSQRSWWSRFWNPNSQSWWNPRSWSRSGRERGEDEETILKMEQIVSELSGITRETQKIRTTISRLKSEVAGYTTGSHENLGPKSRVPPSPSGQPPYGRKENPGNISVIEPYVQKLDPDNWNQSVLSVQQLQWLLRKKLVVNEYNQEIVGRATELIKNLFDGMNRVYEHISNIQSQMDELRTHPAVLGREQGLYSDDNKNPWALISPAEEYADLETILERLYANPFDAKAQWYAQKLHARLWDKLRYIERPLGEDYQTWMSKEPTSTTSPNTGPSGITPIPANELTDALGVSTPQAREIIQRVVQALIAVPEWRETANRFWDMSQQLFDTVDEHKSPTDSPASPSTATETSSAAPSTSPPPPAGEPSAAVSEYGDDVLEDISDEQAQALLAEFPELRGVDKAKLEAALRRVHVPSKGGRRETVRKLRPRPREAMNIFNIVKLADLMDKHDKEIADILDQLIERYDVIDPLKFPEFSVPIKEEGILVENSTI